MRLTKDEKNMLAGKMGRAVQKSMEILVALGTIYGAKKLIDVSSVQIAGVSYDNLGQPGLDFLAEMAVDGKTKVLTTLNPAGMDLENWKNLGISSDFAEKQEKVIEAFRKMNVITTCTCTPYLIGNSPHFGEHLAWSESSAVAFANSVLGAYTNREGGPSALASALTGKTPAYGMHLEANRNAQIVVQLEAPLRGTHEFGALGIVAGKKINNKIPIFIGQDKASLEELKSLSASIATYGGTAMFHMKAITPAKTPVPKETILITKKEIADALAAVAGDGPSDFISIGCPHASIAEIEKIAKLLEGKKVKKEVWITTARPTKRISDMMGFTKTIEDAGAKFAADTCCVVAPIKGRFAQITTDSAKMCFYSASKHKMRTRIKSVEECIAEAIQ